MTTTIELLRECATHLRQEDISALDPNTVGIGLMYISSQEAAFTYRNPDVYGFNLGYGVLHLAPVAHALPNLVQPALDRAKNHEWFREHVRGQWIVEWTDGTAEEWGEFESTRLARRAAALSPEHWASITAVADACEEADDACSAAGVRRAIKDSHAALIADIEAHTVHPANWRSRRQAFIDSVPGMRAPGRVTAITRARAQQTP